MLNIGGYVRVMVFNATFNNILVISWWSVILGLNIRKLNQRIIKL